MIISYACNYTDGTRAEAAVQFDATGKATIVRADDDYIRSAIESALRTPLKYETGKLIDGAFASVPVHAGPGTVEHARGMVNPYILLEKRDTSHGDSRQSVKMGDVRSLYHDTWLRASYRLLDYVVEAAEVWDALPDYRKEGKLVCFGQLVSYLATLRTGEATGKLTKAQIRKLRNLERPVKQADGVIMSLRTRYEASRARQSIPRAGTETEGGDGCLQRQDSEPGL